MSTRWLLLLVIEVYAWAGTVAFVVLRYWFDRRRASDRMLISILALEAGLLVIGVADWARSGEWTAYQTVIAAILGYAALRGRRDLHRRRMGRAHGAALQPGATGSDSRKVLAVDPEREPPRRAMGREPTV